MSKLNLLIAVCMAGWAGMSRSYSPAVFEMNEIKFSKKRIVRPNLLMSSKCAKSFSTHLCNRKYNVDSARLSHRGQRPPICPPKSMFGFQWRLFSLTRSIVFFQDYFRSRLAIQKQFFGTPPRKTFYTQ